MSNVKFIVRVLSEIRESLKVANKAERMHVHLITSRIITMLMGLNKVICGREIPYKRVTVSIMGFLSFATASAIVVWLVWHI